MVFMSCSLICLTVNIHAREHHVLLVDGSFRPFEQSTQTIQVTQTTLSVNKKHLFAYDSLSSMIVWWQAHRMTDSLVLALQTFDTKHRIRTLQALASVQDTASLKPLGVALQDSSHIVRIHSAFALGQLNNLQTHTAASVILINRYAIERNEKVRESLVEALGKCGDAKAAEWLLIQKFKTVKLKIASGLALSRITQRGVLAPSVSEKAGRYCLQLIRENRGSLIRFAGTYFFVRTPIAVWASLADSLALLMNEKLMQTMPEAQANVVRAIARTAKPVYINPLLAASTASDWRVRYEAVRALARFSTDTVQTRILALTTDENMHVKLSALRIVFDNSIAVSDEFLHEAKTICLRPLTDWRVRAAYLNIIARRDPNWLLVLFDRWREIAVPEFMATLTEGLAVIPKKEVWNMLDSLTQAYTTNQTVVATAALRALHSKWTAERRDSTQWYRLPEIVNVYYPIFLRALNSGDIALVSTAAEYCTDTLFMQKGSADVMVSILRSVRPFADVEMVQSLVSAIVKMRYHKALSVLDSLAKNPDDGIARTAFDGAETLRKQMGMASVSVQQGVQSRYTAPFTVQDIRNLAPEYECVITTSVGVITLKLFADQAPISVLNFLTHARKGLFNDVPFHRVVANFVIQGGDFERRDGYGGPRYAIPSEFTAIPFMRGTVGMASAGKDTEGSQYFIMHSYAPHLDGRYTAFGQVTAGLETVDAVLQGHKVLSVQIR